MSEAPESPSRSRGFVAAIPRWSIRNPHTVVAFYLAVVLLSIGALLVLPTRMMPYVPSPMIAVVTMYPGLGPEEMEAIISKPIEERLTDLAEVRFIRSTSQYEFSIVTAEFHYGTDMRKALFNVQQLMNLVQADLPYDRANLKPSWVLPIDPLNIPVLSLSLAGEGWDPVALRQLAANQIVSRLKAVPGVQSVVPFGGQRRQIQIIVDREKLAAYRLSLLDIRDRLDMNNVSRSAGVLTSGPREAIIRADARFLEGRPFAQVPLGTYDGRVVYLSDVARAEDTAAEQRSRYHYNGRESVEVSIIQEPAASSPQVLAGVFAELRRIEAEYPGLRFEEAYNDSTFVRALTRNMTVELLSAAVLAGGVLLFFLGQISATLIVMVTIPICLGMAILLFVPSGMSINSSTLIGLLLAIGRLVDDAIVGIHSTHEHLKIGLPPPDAAADGTAAVIKPVMAATFTLILALVPLTLSGGITQQMFQGIVWPIIFALAASLLVALTLTPLMAAHFFRPVEAGRAPSRLGRSLAPIQAAIAVIEQGYVRLLRWSLASRVVVVCIVVAALVGASVLYPFIGKEMMPLADTARAYIRVEATPGTSLEKTTDLVRQFERILLRQPEIRKVSTEIGFEAGGTYFTGYGMGNVNEASLMVTLTDKGERRRSIWEILDAAQQEGMRTIPGLRRIVVKEMGSDIMASAQAPMDLIVYGPDLARLEHLGHQVRGIAERTTGFVNPTTNWARALPEYRLEIDRARAAELGLTVRDIADQLYHATRGGFTTEFFRPLGIRQTTVLVRYEAKDRRGHDDLEQVLLTSPMGMQVPLKSVATIVERKGPTLVTRDNGRRTISVLGFYRRGLGPGEEALTMTVMDAARMTLPWPPGYGIDMRGDMTQMMDSFRRLLIGLALAVVFIYLVLVAQFRSMLQPLTMLLSVPLELLGAFGALLLMRQTFSTVSILGIVMLTGIVVSNAVLLIDLIMEKRAQGIERARAILEAGPYRLRPILMTSLVTIVVLVPVAFFPRSGIDAYAPLATAIIGGLAVSTLLTLVAVPVVYTIMDDVAQAVGRFGRRRARPGLGAD